MPELRFYLTGGVAIEGSQTLDQGALPGRQGRLALVYLLVERHRPVSIDELATAVWGDELPRTWEPSLRVVISKLRTVLTQAGTPHTTIVTDGGCYRVRLGDAWVDIEVAANAVDRAEGAWRHGDVATTWSPSNRSEMSATVTSCAPTLPLVTGPRRYAPTSNSVTCSSKSWVSTLPPRPRSCTSTSCEPARRTDGTPPIRPRIRRRSRGRVSVAAGRGGGVGSARCPR